MNFLRQLFTDLTCDHSHYIITFLLGSFLIGFLTRYFMSLRKIRNAEESLERSKLELKQSKKLRDGLQEKYDLKEADYQKATLSLTERTRSLNAFETEKKQLNGRLRSTLDEYEKAKAEHTQTTARLEEMNDQILGLRTKNSQLNSELEQRTATINQYADTQVDNNRQKELEAIISKLRSENATLKSATIVTSNKTEGYELLEQKIAQLEGEREQWGDSLSEITQLEEGNAALNASMLQLIEQNELLKDQVEELSQYESGNEILNATVLQLMEENEALKTKKTSSTSTATTVYTHAPREASTTSAAIGTEDLSTAQAKAKIKSAIGNKIAYATVAEKDDLKKIQGIGPFIEEKLNDLGIYTFAQLSQFDESMIPTLTAAIEFFPGRIERDEWIGQADRLAYMKRGGGGAPTTSRRVISRTVVTRPKEESFVSEKKAVQEKIIVDAAPQKITRVVRREPIRRVERIVKKESVTTTEKVELPKPPKAEVARPTESAVENIPIITPIPTPTPAASPGLKESISRKIVIPTMVPPVEMEETQEEIKAEEATKESDAMTVEELFEEDTKVEEIAAEQVPTEAVEEVEQIETTEETASEETTNDGETATATTEMEEQPPVPAQPVVPDDLQKIEGIGPKISALLNNVGVLTYQQLASKSYDELQDIIDDAGPRFRIARPKSWPQQAALAAQGRWDDLKDLQARMRGGVLD